MDVAKLAKAEIKEFDIQGLREAEIDVRRELAMMRMDLYGDKRQTASKVTSLKKSLARILTCRSVLNKKTK